MSKTTIITINQREGKKPKVQIDVVECGELTPRLGYQGKMKAEELIEIICKIYDIEPNTDLLPIAMPKAHYECNHCHKVFTKAVASCDRCTGEIERVK